MNIFNIWAGLPRGALQWRDDLYWLAEGQAKHEEEEDDLAEVEKQSVVGGRERGRLQLECGARVSRGRQRQGALARQTFCLLKIRVMRCHR